MSNSPPNATTVRSEVRDSFAPEDCALLDAITLPGSAENPFHLLETVVGWGREVRLLTEQLDRSYWEHDPTVGGAYDLVGAMFARDRVEALLPAVPVRLLDRTRRVVEVFDSEFRHITVDDKDSEMIRLAGDVSPDGAGWWWRRVPARGPVREELDQNSLPATLLTTEIRPRFTADELAELDAVTSDPEHSRERLLDQISHWAAAVHGVEHVQSDPRLRALNTTIDPRRTLHRPKRRDRIEQLLSQVPEGLLGEVQAVLDKYDERYRAVTVVDDTGLLPRTARRIRDPDAWWWHRIPPP